MWRDNYGFAFVDVVIIAKCKSPLIWLWPQIDNSNNCHSGKLISIAGCGWHLLQDVSTNDNKPGNAVVLHPGTVLQIFHRLKDPDDRLTAIMQQHDYVLSIYFFQVYWFTWKILRKYSIVWQMDTPLCSVPQHCFVLYNIKIWIIIILIQLI